MVEAAGTATFTVTLSSASDQSVSVDWHPQDGTATRYNSGDEQNAASGEGDYTSGSWVPGQYVDGDTITGYHVADYQTHSGYDYATYDTIVGYHVQAYTEHTGYDVNAYDTSNVIGYHVNAYDYPSSGTVGYNVHGYYDNDGNWNPDFYSSGPDFDSAWVNGADAITGTIFVHVDAYDAYVPSPDSGSWLGGYSPIYEHIAAFHSNAGWPDSGWLNGYTETTVLHEEQWTNTPNVDAGWPYGSYTPILDSHDAGHSNASSPDSAWVNGYTETFDDHPEQWTSTPWPALENLIQVL